MYAVVKFLKRNDAPGVVCTHWINDEQNWCKYPNVRTNEVRDRLIRKLVQPEEDWDSCPIKILCLYNSFSKAVSHIPKAEQTSNLDTEDEIINEPRKKIKRVILNAESQKNVRRTSKKIRIDPYPDPHKESPSLLQLKVPQRSSQNNVCEISKDIHIDPFSDSCEDSPLLQPEVPEKKIQILAHEYSQPETTSQSSSSSSLSLLSNLEKPPESSSSQAVFNEKLVAWMADISDKIQKLTEKMDNYLENEKTLLQQNQVPEGFGTNEDLEILGSLPITDDKSFVELNKKICADDRLRQLLVKVLISVGGKDMRCHIYNMLRRLLSDDVAELYTLSGKSTLKNTMKKSFLSTEVSKSIFSACQRVFEEDATEFKIKEAVGDWLNQAKVRKFRRMQRHEKTFKDTEL